MSLDTRHALPDNAPRPRACHVTKWRSFDGYGFNLHAEKSKPGQRNVYWEDSMILTFYEVVEVVKA